ncbi:MAG TPA: L-seryl-tRNA(Sec) selenium transferase [Pirellulaceae bacterium]|nr:L-seryl-tRNA(Sec) selenium transferase [Pirellulaceae bacterium]
MPSNFFDKFPSVSELLDSPPLKQLVEQASRNVVVTNVKSFVGRMASDLQTRATEMKVPSVGELAERIAQWIAKQRAGGPQAEINATGILLADDYSLPLAEEALHRLDVTLRDYVGQRRGAERNIAELLRQLTGAEDALVTATHSGAVLLALAATGGEKPIVIARGEVGEIDSGVPLPQIAKSAGVTLRECGTVERTRSEDLAEALIGAGALLSVASTRYAIAGGATVPTTAELAALAKRQQLELIADLGLGGLIDPTQFGLAGIPQASATVAAGADIVILSGDRLLGGPACGVIVGRAAAIERLRKHALAPALAASPVVLLPLAATLELYQDLETAQRTIPLLALLTTNIENLKNRAERLAPQLAASPLVTSAQVVPGHASLLGRELAGQQLATWKIVLEPKALTSIQLADKLRHLSLPVIVSVTGDRVVIDLRTVFPRQDMQLAEAFQTVSSDEPQPAKSSPKDESA